MGTYRIYANGHADFTNVANGIGELYVKPNGITTGYLYFSAETIPAGEVFERASGLAVYCQANSASLLVGKIANPVSTGPEWRYTSDGLYQKDGRLVCNIAFSTSGNVGQGLVWLDGSDHVPYADVETSAGKITPTNLYPSSGTIKKGFFQRFSWDNIKDTPINGPLDVQFSTFSYRGTGETQWKNVRIEGNRSYLDFDTGLVANTEVPGMEWYVTIHASSGAEITSSQIVVGFESTSVRLAELSPASNGKTYKGFDINFSWEMSYNPPTNMTGTLRQVSGTLRWRKKGTTEITSYQLATAMQYTVGGEVLPIGAVEWQLDITNTSGSNTVSDWVGFNNIELSVSPVDLYPSAGSKILKGQVNRFGWSLEVKDADTAPGAIVQTGAVLRTRTLGQTEFTEIDIHNAQNYYDFPPDSFVADDIEWQVEVTANTGTTGTSDWIAVNTQDAQSTPVCVNPVGMVVDDAQGITFTWRHIVSTGTKQTAYELQTSSDLGSHYITLSAGTGDIDNYTTAPASFPQGTLMWRVRTKNGDDVWGAYGAVATIIIRRAPVAPIITYTDTLPRPTIRWQSLDQQGVRIQIGAHDTGWLHSTAKEYTVPTILPDGNYRVTVSIKTVFGVESQPATISIAVKNKPGPAIKTEAKARLNAVYINWLSYSEYAEYIVLRDGIPIARTIEQNYVDNLSVGKHIYAVWGIASDGYYGQSDDLHVYLAVDNAVISDVANVDWLSLRYRRNGRPEHNERCAPDITLVRYAGRARPVPYTSPMMEGTHELAYSFRSRAEYIQLKALQGHTVVYKDCFGNLFIGVLGEVTAQLQQAVDVTFTITETDFEEAINYGGGIS